MSVGLQLTVLGIWINPAEPLSLPGAISLKDVVPGLPPLVVVQVLEELLV